MTRRPLSLSRSQRQPQRQRTGMLLLSARAESLVEAKRQQDRQQYRRTYAAWRAAGQRQWAGQSSPCRHPPVRRW
jgi:hypothetical protein